MNYMIIVFVALGMVVLTSGCIGLCMRSINEAKKEKQMLEKEMMDLEEEYQNKKIGLQSDFEFTEKLLKAKMKQKEEKLLEEKRKVQEINRLRRKLDMEELNLRSMRREVIDEMYEEDVQKVTL